MPVAKMRELAFALFKIYVFLNVACAAAFWCCGVSFLDAIAHAFSTVATGGFSSRNASVAYFATDPEVNSVAFELTALFFMIVASTNYGLLYWVALRKPGKLFRDAEWRTYLTILIVATVATFGFGWAKGDFEKTTEARLTETTSAAQVATLQGEAKVAERDVVWNATAFPQISGSLSDENAEIAKVAKDTRYKKSGEDKTSGQVVGIVENNETSEASASASWLDSLRISAFTVVSLASGTGFAATRYELWNATSLLILAFVMFCGGCAASTAGGAKIYRVVLLGKAILLGVERTRSPNVVRATRYNGENLERDFLNFVVLHLTTLVVLILALTLTTLACESDAPWANAPSPQIEKFADMSGAALSMFSNVGPAFGKIGALENYGFLSAPTKLLYGGAMLIGRLEIWIVLAVLTPGFWRRN
jgi:Trk-type K+ transport system membrane component